MVERDSMKNGVQVGSVIGPRKVTCGNPPRTWRLRCSQANNVENLSILANPLCFTQTPIYSPDALHARNKPRGVGLPWLCYSDGLL